MHAGDFKCLVLVSEKTAYFLEIAMASVEL